MNTLDPREQRASSCATPLVQLLNAVRRRTAVRRYTIRMLNALGHAPLMESGGSSGVRTLVIGRDPVRVLLFGAGIAIGYGARTRAEALDGPLAERIANTGRGVVLENRAVQHLHIGGAVGALGAAGTHTFHAAVWFPSFTDATSLRSLRAWRAQLHQLIREVRAESSIPLVLTCMPALTGKHLIALIGRPWINALNKTIAQVAAEHDGVVVAELTSFAIGDSGQLSQDLAYFVSVAEILAPVVLQALGIENRTSAQLPGSGVPSVILR